MDGRIAAIWTPAVESLLQRTMRDHGSVFAQGFAQNQIAFRPMVVTGGCSHQNISGCPLPYAFQSQQSISYTCVFKTFFAMLRKESGQHLHGLHATTGNSQTAEVSSRYLFRAGEKP